MSTPPDTDRSVPLEGAYNWRDLGGLVTEEGRSIRGGRLYRSDTLQELTQDDVRELVHRRGLRTVIDLRTPVEVLAEGHGPLAELTGIAHVELSLLGDPRKLADQDVLPALPEDDMAGRYLSYLMIAGPAVVEALRVIAEPGSLPAVVHCAAGKDRTGVLVALVLLLLGVSEEEITADYALTTANMDRIFDRLDRLPSYAGTMTRPRESYNAHPESMRGFLTGLREQHGGARAWVLSQGLTEADIERLQDALLVQGQETAG